MLTFALPSKERDKDRKREKREKRYEARKRKTKIKTKIKRAKMKRPPWGQLQSVILFNLLYNLKCVHKSKQGNKPIGDNIL